MELAPSFSPVITGRAAPILIAGLSLFACGESAAPIDTGAVEEEPLRTTWIGTRGRGMAYGRYLASPRTGEAFYAGQDPPDFWCESGCDIDDTGGEAWEGDPGTSGDVYVEEASTATFEASQPVPLPEGACPDEPCVLFGLGKPIDVLLVGGSRVISNIRVPDPEYGFMSAVGLASFSDWSGFALYWQPIGDRSPLAEGIHLLDLERVDGDVIVDTVDASLLFDGLGTLEGTSTHDYSGDGVSDLGACVYRVEDERYMCLVAEGPWRGDRHAETADVWIYDTWGRLSSDAPAPDFDGDGYSDLYLMKSDWDQAQVGLFFGPLTGAVEFDGADVTIGEDSGSELIGLSPQHAGDVDGDGWQDLLIRSGSNAPDHISGSGVVSVLLGPFDAARGLSEAVLVLYGTEEDGNFGYAMAGLGDVDGDGADEFAIGAPGAYDGDGAVYIYSYLSP